MSGGWSTPEARKRWEQANPEKMAAQQQRQKMKRQTTEGRKKRNAATLVQKRVARGKYPKVSVFKCVDCERQAQHYHHTDYDLPWLVVPMCHFCHRQEHLRLAPPNPPEGVPGDISSIDR
jgi:hypothetical protein